MTGMNASNGCEEVALSIWSLLWNRNDLLSLYYVSDYACYVDRIVAWSFKLVGNVFLIVMGCYGKGDMN